MKMTKKSNKKKQGINTLPLDRPRAKIERTAKIHENDKKRFRLGHSGENSNQSHGCQGGTEW